MSEIHTGISCPFCNAELMVREVTCDGSPSTTMSLKMNGDFSIDNPWLPEYAACGADVGLEAFCTNEDCTFGEVAEISDDNYVSYLHMKSGMVKNFIDGEWVDEESI
ncbi:MAG TPA: hypothetical protein PKK43_10625 [Spirochaetota bacterium]|nr:hypothetical protein [Spirochaetota bacterium]